MRPARTWSSALLVFALLFALLPYWSATGEGTAPTPASSPPERPIPEVRTPQHHADAVCGGPIEASGLYDRLRESVPDPAALPAEEEVAALLERADAEACAVVALVLDLLHCDEDEECLDLFELLRALIQKAQALVEETADRVEGTVAPLAGAVEALPVPAPVPDAAPLLAAVAPEAAALTADTSTGEGGTLIPPVATPPHREMTALRSPVPGVPAVPEVAVPDADPAPAPPTPPVPDPRALAPTAAS